MILGCENWWGWLDKVAGRGDPSTRGCLSKCTEMRTSGVCVGRDVKAGWSWGCGGELGSGIREAREKDELMLSGRAGSFHRQ